MQQKRRESSRRCHTLIRRRAQRVSPLADSSRALSFIDTNKLSPCVYSSGAVGGVSGDADTSAGHDAHRHYTYYAMQAPGRASRAAEMKLLCMLMARAHDDD